MARIELRHCVVRIRDGFGGTAAVNDMSIAGGNTTLDIDTVANLTNNTSVVPVGARFTVATVDTTYVVTAQNANKVITIAYTADAGTWTLTVNGVATASMDFDFTPQEVEDAINLALGATVADVTGSAGSYTIQFIGDLANTAPTVSNADALTLSASPVVVTQATVHAGAATWQLTFSPPLSGGDLPANDGVITFSPQYIDIKIGDGDLKYTETTEYNYDLDRGDLDTVREGNQVPMEVSLNFTYEHITTGTSETIAPMDAIKRRGGASGWVSTASDPCEPYAVDVIVIHTPPCGASQGETTTFPDFRSEKREPNFKDSNISITGRCNAVEPEVTRG